MAADQLWTFLVTDQGELATFPDNGAGSHAAEPVVVEDAQIDVFEVGPLAFSAQTPDQLTALRIVSVGADALSTCGCDLGSDAFNCPPPSASAWHFVWQDDAWARSQPAAHRCEIRIQRGNCAGPPEPDCVP